MYWTLTEHKGHIAVTLPWQRSWTEPVEYKVFRVCDAPTGRWRPLLGNEVRFRGNHGYCFNHYGQPARMDTTNWTTVTIERPIRRPRKRQGYTYTWQHGDWHLVPTPND